MKKSLLLLGIALVISTVASYGQMSQKELEKIAEEQSAVLEKEGWKPNTGGLPLKYQLKKVYTMQEEVYNGQSKYIISEGKIKGTSYEAAKVHAMEIAKRNMISMVDNMSVTDTEGDIINVDGADAESESLSETKYKSSSSLELGNLTTVLVCYREIAGGKVEVMVQLACTTENAIKAKLKKSKGQTKAQTTTQKVTTTHTL